MPWVNRDENGTIAGKYANRQPGYANEWLDDDAPELSIVSPSQMVVAERAWRDGELLSVKWLRERHRDQVEIAIDPTLSPEYFKELLVYMQALRDWPQSPDFPDSQHRPTEPLWLAEQTD